MLKSKFFEILRSFSRDELKEFNDFVRSPFHNSNKNVIKLFEFVRKAYPEFSSEILTKEKLFKRLYPGKKYNDTVMRILSSDLLSLSEEFIAYKRYTGRAFDKTKFLLEELKERKLWSLFTKHEREAGNILKSSGISIEHYFLNSYHRESSKIDFLISRDRQSESGLNLVKKSEYLICFALTNILNIVQELSEYEEVLNEKPEFMLAAEFLRSIDLERVMKYMKDNGYEYYEIIEIYFLMYKCLFEKEASKNYARLREAIEKNLEKFSREEQFNLFLILESCYLTLMRYGQIRKYDELLEVYELMLKHEIFSVSTRDYMQANLFRNIFYTAVVVGKYSWAEKFISDFSGYLLPEQKEDMINYSSAILKFERKKYEEALGYIAKVNYGFFVFKFEARVLMMKIYYEMKLFEALGSLIDAFSHFLAKNKIVSEIYKEQFMNFLKFLKILIKYSQSHREGISTDIHELKKYVENTHLSINKRWILEKVEEIIHI